MVERCLSRAVLFGRRGERRLRQFFMDDDGQAATEYILIIGLICIVIIVAFNRIHETLRGLLERIAGSLNGPGI